MIKCEFYTLGYKDRKYVATLRKGYTDAKGTLRATNPIGVDTALYYNRIGRVWYCVALSTGTAIAEGKTKDEAFHNAHTKERAAKVQKYIQTELYKRDVKRFNELVESLQKTQE